MTTVYEIPLIASPQTLSISIGGITYQLTLLYHTADQNLAGWVMDIADVNSNPIVNGIPLVTGANLLAQYAYLNIGNGAGLAVVSDGTPSNVPTFKNLGSSSHLYILTNP